MIAGWCGICKSDGVCGPSSSTLPCCYGSVVWWYLLLCLFCVMWVMPSLVLAMLESWQETLGDLRSGEALGTGPYVACSAFGKRGLSILLRGSYPCLTVSSSFWTPFTSGVQNSILSPWLLSWNF